MALDPGEVFAGYRVHRLIGQGAVSHVYRVDRAGQPYALKVLDTDLREGAGDRFRREVEVTRALSHPHIVRVYASGELAGQLWMAMQLVDGGTAAALVPTGRRAPRLWRVLDVLGAAASGLDHAHAHGVIHRDVKPANILLGTHATLDEVVVTDFGLARFLDDTAPVARHGRVQGTLPYVAPEVLSAGRLTPAVDTYALACAAVELLTGRPPYPRRSPIGIVSAHLRDDPPSLVRRRSWLPEAVDAVVARSLAKDPAERHPTCAAFVLELGEALEFAEPRTARAPYLSLFRPVT